MRHASCDLQHAADFRVTGARAPLRWLSFGRWQNTQACRARAPCCAGCDRPTQYDRTLHWPKTFLFPCKTVVRRASCGVQRAAGIRVARSQAPLCWLCLGRWRNTRPWRARALCRADCGRYLRYRMALHQREASLFGARPWCDVRAVTSNSAAGISAAHLQAPLRWLSLGSWLNTRACRACAPCRAGCGRLLRREIELHRRKASLFRCKMVVRCASCNLQRAAGIHVARAQAPLRWLCLRRWQNTQACRARRPCRAGGDMPSELEGHCTGGRPLSVGARPWCDV